MGEKGREKGEYERERKGEGKNAGEKGKGERERKGGV